METLARTIGLTHGTTTVPSPPRAIPDLDETGLRQWIELAGSWLGLEPEPADIPYGQIGQYLKTAGAAILRITGVGETRFVALAGVRRGSLRVLGSDGSIHSIRAELLQSALCRHFESVHAVEV